MHLPFVRMIKGALVVVQVRVVLKTGIMGRLGPAQLTAKLFLMLLSTWPCRWTPVNALWTTILRPFWCELHEPKLP